jgi:glycosyltransferase involved in cell wall biosynthesis
VTVIDKENGHHGSCTNAALPVAKGKYVKVLDADDWFDTDAFAYLIDKLQTLDSDLVITNYSKQYIAGKTELVRFCSQDYVIRHDTPPPIQNTVNKDDTKCKHTQSGLTPLNPAFPIFPLCLSMHAVAYKTDLLRNMNYKQSEGIAYTDEDWVFFPMFYVKTIAFINIDVYRHFLGRPGQTMDPAVFDRNISHRGIGLLRRIAYYFSFDRETLSQHANDYLFYRLKNQTKFHYESYLLWRSEKDIDLNELKSFDVALREQNEMFYDFFSNDCVHKYMPIKSIRYFRKHAKRLPSWSLCFLRMIKHVKKTAERLVYHKR